jgi:hypothetical protein
LSQRKKVETGDQTGRFGLVYYFVPGRVGHQKDAAPVKQNQRQNNKVKTPTLPKTGEEWGTQKARKREAKSKTKQQSQNTHPSQNRGRVGHPKGGEA